MAKGKNENDWQIEQDLRTLTDAREIQEDPKRLAAVKALAKEKLLDLASVAAIATVAEEKS